MFAHLHTVHIYSAVNIFMTSLKMYMWFVIATSKHILVVDELNRLQNLAAIARLASRIVVNGRVSSVEADWQGKLRSGLLGETQHLQETG